MAETREFSMNGGETTGTSSASRTTLPLQRPTRKFWLRFFNTYRSNEILDMRRLMSDLEKRYLLSTLLALTNPGNLSSIAHRFSPRESSQNHLGKPMIMMRWSTNGSMYTIPIIVSKVSSLKNTLRYKNTFRHGMKILPRRWKVEHSV